MTSTLRGQLDLVDRSLVRGWAQDARTPTQPVSLLVTLNETLIGRVIANRFRQDLADAGLGTGCHGFELPFGASLSPLSTHRIRVTRELDGVELALSPWLVEPATMLGEPELDRLATLLADVAPDDQLTLDRRLAFLLRQVDQLLDLRHAGKPGLDRRASAWRRTRLSAGTAAAEPDPSPTGTPDQPRALVIDEVTPDDRRDAGSCAVVSHMMALQRLGFHVSLVAADLSASAENQVLAAGLRDVGIAVHGSPFHASVEEVLRRHGAGLDVVYLHRGPVAFRYARLVRHHSPGARLLYAVADLQHLRLARQARVEERPELLPLARDAQRRELDGIASADAVLTHSSYEAAMITRVMPRTQVHVVPWVVRTAPVRRPFAAREGLAFLADYAHAPNLDAAGRLLREVMPLVWRHEPTMPCLLAGSRMPPDLAGPDPRIVPVGHVPELAQLFDRVRLTVAPLAYGAGIKGKVLESLAAGLPCVGSPMALEGLDLPQAVRRWTAADPESMARSVLALHRSAALNRSTARAGLDWVRTTLSEQHIDALLDTAVRTVRPNNPSTSIGR